MAPGIGGFGGLFPLVDSYLVAGTDGVGTKVMLAFETGIHDTIGIDLVAMSVNDIVTSGAKPLFFLDYCATGHLDVDVDVAEQVIKGIVDGCKQSDCVLLGGETAEMPSLYIEGEYDLSGCAVGIVKKDSVINGKNIVTGDVLLGLPSSGVHSNGFSLARRALAQSGLSLKDQLPGATVTVAEALMAPTVIYVKQVLDLISKGGVKGIAHITGGGFSDNIPRVFPEGLGASIYKDSWDVPPVFKWLQEWNHPVSQELEMAFEDFDPIFCEPKVELSAHSSSPLMPFLLHVYAIDTSQIVIHATDFHSITLEANLSVPLLEDTRDVIGIGGSWSEFVDYFVASLKSEDLKLVMEAKSNSDGASSAKLVAQKSKGMPLITIPLTKLVDSAASEAMSNLSLGLFKAFKSIKCSLVEEQEHSSRMTNMIAAEKERNETAQQQLEQCHKFQKISDSEKANVSTHGQQNSPNKQTARGTGSTKFKNRVVPVHRRTKVRGALLNDSDNKK